MSERERLVAALWKQTDELLFRTRRQIEALSAREPERNIVARNTDKLDRGGVAKRARETRPRF